MTSFLRTTLRSIFSLLLVLALGSAGSAPLSAQVDPRLQATKTDFLNLYQQSTNVKLKPEIVTLFDYSGSMAALMYHPLWKNLDRSDNDMQNNIQFVLTPAVAAGINSYTIRFESKQDPLVWASIDILISNTGVVTASTVQTPYLNTGFTANGNNFNNIWTSTSPITMAGSGTTRTFSITVYVYNNTGSAKTLDTGVNAWTIFPSGAVLSPLNISTSFANVANKNQKSTVQATVLNVPAYSAATPARDPFVTATLDIRPGSSAVAGYTYLSTILKSTILVKPNGSIVTKTDAATVAPINILNGDTQGVLDVRNWIRAASHVRFQALVGTDTRTIDVPIPWKITDSTSTGNPLLSTTVLDMVIKGSTTYGSSLQMEMDLNYSIAGGDSVLTNTFSKSGNALGNTQANWAEINTVSYPAGYISWLFNGKYTVGSYIGKYIVFDAAIPSLAGGQGDVGWGRGYGNNIPIVGNKSLAGIGIKVPDFNSDGTYKNTESDQYAKVNVIPAFIRAQAVKRAAIQTWIENQADVLWAFRFLDPLEAGAGGTSPNGPNIHNDSTTNQNVTAGVPITYQTGRDSTWTLLNNTTAEGIININGNSVKGMKRIASLFVGNSTPLTYATASALAQFNDPNSVFNAIETGVNAPSTCMNHFLIIFTDGVDNNNSGTVNGNGTSPYLVAGNITALAGNQNILDSPHVTGQLGPTSINRTGTFWNFFTFSAIAAHLSDAGLGANPNTDYQAAILPAAGTSNTPSTFLPFAIKQRGTTAIDFGTYGHRITTMTLGVSLGGYYTDSAVTYSISPKRSMFLAAALGDPTVTTGALSSFRGFDPAVDWEPTPSDPGNFPAVGQRKAGAVYFFDGSDPDKIANSLQYALRAALSPANLSATSNPNLPFIGASLGKQIYLGQFTPPTTGGVIWNGDLLMFPTKEIGSKTAILNKLADVTTVLNDTTAQWSALQILKANRKWYNRNLWTRLPYLDASTPEPAGPLVRFSDLDPQYSVIKNAIMTLKPTPSTVPYPITARSPAATDAEKKAVIQKAMGGDLTNLDPVSPFRPLTNRNSIMGDVINSSPTAIEYQLSEVTPGLTAPLLTMSGPEHFRLVLAGTNQGWLHAFGEVTKQVTKIDSYLNNQVIVNGVADELWSFMPTDLLGQLDYLYGPATGGIHRFAVDGAPVIYHLDLPPAAGGSPNGVVDSTERVIAIVSMRKGGRSYYGLDIHDPYTPTLKWSLCPDEAAYFPQGRIEAGGPALATVKAVLGTMGFSTSTPALARMKFNGVVRDVVMFSGGYSTSDVEAQFLVAGNPTKLGRSVMALDVYTGKVLAAIDMTTVSAGIDCIPAGVVPFEFFLNSGMAQRAYFLDFKGGLWAWGSKQKATAGSFTGYRQDNSDLALWTSDGTSGGAAGIRKVAQDGNGVFGNLYTTLPAPFKVGTFTGVGVTSGSPAVTAPTPAAVGVAMISGDRNNPMDQLYTTGVDRPGNHRLTVVFDRQDSGVSPWNLDTTGILDAKLLDASTLSIPTNVLPTPDFKITPGKATYYLAPTTGSPAVADTTNTKFGYYLNLPSMDASTKLTSKGITEPIVVAGSLFYSYFRPTVSDPCTGGDGNSYTNLICDVLNPIVSDLRTSVSCLSGNKAIFSGVNSSPVSVGSRGIIQAGAKTVPSPPIGSSKTALEIQTILGKTSERYPRVRVWRTVR